MARGFKIKAGHAIPVAPEVMPAAKAAGSAAAPEAAPLPTGPLAPQPAPRMDSRLKRSTDDPRLLASEDRTVVDSREQVDDSRFEDVDDEWSFDKMPALPDFPGYRTIWLSTTHKQDTIPRRLKLGYQLLTVEECPDLSYLASKHGEYTNVIMCEEMLAAKLPEELYQRYMNHFHHKKPLEDEGGIREEIERVQERARAAKGRVDLEEGMRDLGKARGQDPRKPRFA